MVKRHVLYYNLDVIISVGYRVKSLDAYAHIVSLIKQARHSIVLIDNYIDESTLTMLSKRDAGVSAGKKLFAYIKMQETNPTELLRQIH